MPDYHFSHLSPHDFETLARDLLQAQENIRLESFKTGKDGGVDFRYATASGALIVQSKNFETTGLKGLLRELKKEAANVKALNPTRYILVTSVGLSDVNQKEIINIIGPCLKPADVIGRDDINNLLGLHPEVEKAHFKLWLASTPVLEKILHSAETTQSEFQIDQIKKRIQRYVQNNAYGEALTRLEKHGVVIISGLPGVGKTTLADLLLYDHMAKGFQPVAIRNGFDEARTLYKEGVSQIFHYDDFIGATFLGDRAAGFTKNEDRAILDFVNLIRDSKHSRMILTTREHILQQAINTSERLEHARVVDHRFVLTLQHYSKEQRAKILYNHVYFSDLPPAFIKALLADDFFMTILDHEKFTPRLVEWLSDYRRVGKETSAADYPKFVERLLANPAEIWRHAYRQQISDAARSFLLGLYSMNGRTGVTPLRRAFDPLHAHRSKRYQFLTKPHDFSTALKELNGGFISISGGLVEFINPSVIDFINDELRHAPENAVDIVQGASRFEQAGHVFRVARAQSGGASLIAALWQNDTQIAEALERLLAVPRKTQFVNGAVGFGDTTREARLNQIVRLANEHRSPLIAKLIPTAFEYLRKHVAEEEVHVEDAMDIVRTFKTADWDGVTMHGSIADELLAMVLEGAREGCSAYDLNEILSQIPQPTAEQLSTLRQAYARFEKDWFQDDLKNCADGGEYAGLDQSLDAFASRLGVDVSEPKRRVEAAMDHYAEQEERRADDMYDSWKDQKYDREFEDTALRHMFDSLRKSGD